MTVDRKHFFPCPVCGQAMSVNRPTGPVRVIPYWQPVWSDRAFCSRECARTGLLVRAIDNTQWGASAEIGAEVLETSAPPPESDRIDKEKSRANKCPTKTLT